MCCQNWSEVDIHVSVLGLTLSNLTSILLLAAGICGLIGVGHGQVLALVVASVAFGACNIVTTLFAAYLVWRHKQWAVGAMMLLLASFLAVAMGLFYMVMISYAPHAQLLSARNTAIFWQFALSYWSTPSFATL